MLDSLLSEAKMTRAELARRLKIHPNTVTRWGNEAPGYAVAYLDLLIGVRRLAQ